VEPTEKLYFNDSSVLEFEARIVGLNRSASGCQVILDRTAFYPTGGGQPNDTGQLNDDPVIDVIEDESGAILHILKDCPALTLGAVILGKIDRARRLDHLQQHSGQHILSQAFIQASGAETRSFHLGPLSSTIDIELQTPTDAVIRAAEELANAAVFEDRPMRVHMVNDEQAAHLPLRKESAVQGTIRVIEIEGFDWSPCGGTHANRTGQVGLIAVRSFERAKRMTRVEFVCGHRALEDYRLAHGTAVRVARMFSAERDTAPEMVAKTLEENKEFKKRTRELLDLALTAEASRALASARQIRGFKLIKTVFDLRDPDEMRMLASKIVGQEPAIALLATKRSDGGRLVFARSSSLTTDMGKLMADACVIIGGRGGGRPELAQGGGPETQRLAEAIESAVAAVESHD
jgi:alanyl-tRNA synthetase